MYIKLYFMKKRSTYTATKLINYNSINKKNSGGYTPLDRAYRNDSPLRQEIIALLRSKGGKANCFDANGRMVGEGYGDLNY